MPHRGGKNQKSPASGKGNQRREDALDPSTPVDAQKTSTIWQYESPGYQVASSLPVLSLLVSEAPAQPQEHVRARETRRLPRFDEIDTVPPQSAGEQQSASHDGISLHFNGAPTSEISPVAISTGAPSGGSRIDEIDTAPPVHESSISASSQALVPIATQVDVEASGGVSRKNTGAFAAKERDSSSWTAGVASRSPYAQLISDRRKRKKTRRSVALNPLDRMRWWLLHPGRMEFTLWVIGTALLVSVTCVLLLVAAFSLEWLTPGLPSGTSSSNATGNSTGLQPVATVTMAPGLKLTILDKGPFLPGQPVHLHGQGFSSHGHVTFMFDGTQPLLDRDGKADSTQADVQGVFTTTVWLSADLPWKPGRHLIVARDILTNYLFTLPIILAPPPIGKGVSNTPVPTAPPGVGVSPTPSGNPGGQPTPVGRTPVPVTPTPTSSTPTVTPTVGTIPTITPTVGSSPAPTITPTGGITPGTTSTTGSISSGSSNLDNVLDHSGEPLLSAQLKSLNPWIWVMGACYSLSMVLLGVAGVLHKRRR